MKNAKAWYMSQQGSISEVEVTPVIVKGKPFAKLVWNDFDGNPSLEKIYSGDVVKERCTAPGEVEECSDKKATKLLEEWGLV